jgi:hypothetical protein
MAMGKRIGIHMDSSPRQTTPGIRNFRKNLRVEISERESHRAKQPSIGVAAPHPQRTAYELELNWNWHWHYPGYIPSSCGKGMGRIGSFSPRNHQLTIRR